MFDSSTARAPKKRRQNKEAKRTYVQEVTENDVLFGRGSGTNSHPGNVAYRIHLLDEQPVYKTRDASGKREMIDVAVLWVKNVQKGRFLSKEEGRYYIASHEQVREKVSQYLREDHTPQGREQKKARLSVNQP